MKVIELKRKPHVFTLKNGESFRLFAGQTKPVLDSLISEEMHEAEKMKYIKLMSEATPTLFNVTKKAANVTKKEQEAKN